ncbi:DUF5959 family protein [Streptomyces sp. NPDC013457]|uniref:DUF5959 family protein n=1 Tax=Streptomyces sp. NPDC013457 TaxID=3364866 RepID=UPI0036FF9AB5
MEAEPIDLVRLTDGGGTVAVRVTGREFGGYPEVPVLVGEFVVRTKFLTGTLKTWIFPDDLTTWEESLAALARGENIAWRKDKRATELHVDVDDPELAEGMIRVSVADRAGSRATARVLLEPADDWIADHRARLARIRETWTD